MGFALCLQVLHLPTAATRGRSCPAEAQSPRPLLCGQWAAGSSGQLCTLGAVPSSSQCRPSSGRPGPAVSRQEPSEPCIGAGLGCPGDGTPQSGAEGAGLALGPGFLAPWQALRHRDSLKPSSWSFRAQVTVPWREPGSLQSRSVALLPLLPAGPLSWDRGAVQSSRVCVMSPEARPRFQASPGDMQRTVGLGRGQHPAASHPPQGPSHLLPVFVPSRGPEWGVRPWTGLGWSWGGDLAL